MINGFKTSYVIYTILKNKVTYLGINVINELHWYQTEFRYTNKTNDDSKHYYKFFRYYEK